MMDKDGSIDLNLKNLWQTWLTFRKGKKHSPELDEFEYHLEGNLFQLHQDLNSGAYRHGSYRTFTVCDNKRREISVAPIRDRIVHRLIYDYLIAMYDKTFIFDVWSSRKSKGLLACIQRTQKFLTLRLCSFVWRADIQKFFDSVDHQILFMTLARRIHDPKVISLIREVISSFPRAQRERERELIRNPLGMPIGNLTSQIFANIFLNELDRFVKHELRVRQYLRYGDDFILIHPSLKKLKFFREQTIRFLEKKINLKLNPKNDEIVKISHGLRFLGMVIKPDKRNLNRRNRKRIKSRMNYRNIASYYGLVKKNAEPSFGHEFNWKICELLKSLF